MHRFVAPVALALERCAADGQQGVDAMAKAAVEAVRETLAGMLDDPERRDSTTVVDILAMLDTTFE